MRISDWSSDVCSSDLPAASVQPGGEGRDFPLQRFDIGGETLDPVGRASVAAAIPAYVVTIGKVDVEGEGAVPFHPFHPGRSEEHTSELQSLMRISYAVFCLKKKTIKHIQSH